jgi:lipid-binding SYLF domain-containing protein
MTMPNRRQLLATAAAGLAALALRPAAARDDARRKEIDAAATASWKKLMAENSAAAALAKKAHGVAIFPKIVKAGLIVGGSGGEGVLRVGGKSVGYWETGGLSVGLQAGAQSYGYVLMFLSKPALTRFREASGFTLGADASVLVMEEGGAGVIDTTNQKADVIAFVFDEKGVMLKLSLEGTKYSKLDI